MAVESVGMQNSAAYRTSSKTDNIQAGAVSDNSTMDVTDFWKLIAAELQYQDMTNPMSNSEMMSQMTQMNSMNTMNSLANAVSNFAIVTNNLAQVTLTGYSTSMLGREVTVAIVDENGEITDQITGVVEGIDLTGSQSIYIDGKAYALSQIMSVGKVPQDDESSGSENDSENGNAQDSENAPEETYKL